MDAPDRRRRRRVAFFAVLAVLSMLAVVTVVVLVTGREESTLPGPCADALAAADTVADAIEREWATASEAVDSVQQALEESDFRELAAECRDV